ncbi:hypothetical protein [Bradyrhizobium sp. Ce-3]|uniref:hypothetical protein n=1 Tax=Bradyrhizobium sp. Ce-3 TaxID=2913970 RepID=UPI001FBB7B7D|nr:hypothetical protein [Bradyrhizobium sp. Ce-3]GKQ49946.1 hypothetical protein BRSPCE3_08010 [Bradyrhizobium sp. Ce-3]
MGLRDITGDLEQRLAMIGEQRKAERTHYESERKALEATHEAKMAELRLEWDGINRALQLELRRLGRTADSAPAASAPAPAMSLDDFFVATVEKLGAASKNNLRDEAAHAGYFPQGEGGRATHATLMNIVRSGRIRQVDSDVYAPALKAHEFQLNGGTSG